MVRELILLPLRVTAAVVGGAAGLVRSRMGGDEQEHDSERIAAEQAQEVRDIIERQQAETVPDEEREAVRGRNPEASDWDEDAPVPPGGSSPDDLIVTDRVKTELFGAVDVPSGQVNLNVEDGVVFLRGNVEDPEKIEELVGLAGAVEGVVRVVNLLEE
jgi:osmotically-inducible protein OsmY